MDEKAAAETAASKLTVQLTKYVILVGGKPAVAVDSEDDASSIIEAAKERFGSMVANLMEEPSFKQDVSVRRMVVDRALYRPTVEEALDALVSGGKGAGTYTIAQGDVASAIAERFGMKLSDLQAMNGGKDLEKLQIGEQIRVSMKEETDAPRLVVVVRNQESGTEIIPFQTETVSSVELRPGKQIELNPGRNGLRRVIRAITYENGVRTGMEVVEEQTIRNAVPRRIAIGISR
jgi:LysM repeat protein